MVKPGERRIPWTAEDDDAIVGTIKQPAVDVAGQLGRTVWAVEKRRSLLFARGALSERGETRPHRTWTAEEDAIVAATLALPLDEAAARIPAHSREAIRLRRYAIKRRDGR